MKCKENNKKVNILLIFTKKQLQIRLFLTFYVLISKQVDALFATGNVGTSHEYARNKMPPPLDSFMFQKVTASLI